VETLHQVEQGAAPRRQQPHDQATYAPLLKPEHEVLDWSRSAPELANQVRGLNPWPVAHTTLEGERVKLWRARPWSGAVPAAAAGGSSQPAEAGSCLGSEKGKGLLVATGDGVLLVQELQPAGSRRMSADEFLAGHDLTGGRFGF